MLVSGFDQLLGTLSGNVATLNGIAGIALVGNSLGGVAPVDPEQVLLEGNTTSFNAGIGLAVGARVINGSIVDNTAQGNLLGGVALRLAGLNATPAESSTIFLTRTMLSGNNLVALPQIPAPLNQILNREFLLQNIGAGAVNITFDGNSSGNMVSLVPADLQFNFDLLNAGPGSVNPMSQLNNTGTPKRIFGSSDDSVTLLFAN